MPSYSAGEVVLVRYPFSDLSSSKIRPAVIVSAPHASQDVLIVPLTSQSSNLQRGEFLLADWAAAGLHVPTVVKRGIYTVHEDLVLKVVGKLTSEDRARVEQSLREWLGLG
jgi:mRNA interferase MazF